MSCEICGSHHKIWNCENFLNKSGPRRWDAAKRIELCFRCLAEGHRGNSCTASQSCGQNRCQELHHKLLHRSNKQQTGNKTKRRLSNCQGNANHNNNNHCIRQRLFVDRDISGSEGNRHRGQSEKIFYGSNNILHREEELAERISASEQVKRQISMEGNYTSQSM